MFAQDMVLFRYLPLNFVNQSEGNGERKRLLFVIRFNEPVRNASPFLLLPDLGQFIRPKEPECWIDKTK
jgi:hypothetical protein